MTELNVVPIRKIVANDHGGMTYASTQRIWMPDNRSEVLADVRVVCDGLQELCARVREYWPLDMMPPELDMLLKFQDYALAQVRNGSLKRFAEACAR